MKRRNFVRALAVTPAAGSLLAQRPAPAVDEPPKIEISVADAVAESTPRFLNKAQFDALEKLGDLLLPAINGAPGSREVEAPQFLDFLIGRSDAARQMAYTAGLDGLNAQAHRQFNKPFADLDNSKAATLLGSLHQTWTYEEPSDPVARFLRVAKADLRTATLNSREYGAGKRFTGSGLYWYPLD
jgi:hypothetical protein